MSRRRDEQPYVTKANQILSDGEWHDGLTVVKEAEKAIPPGPAHRYNETVRELSSARRNGGQAKDRARDTEMEKTVTGGRRAMLRKLVHDYVRGGSWECRPWPLPPGAWRTGGWEVRDVRAGRIALSALITRPELRVSVERLRTLVLQEPALPHTVAGKRTYVSVEAVSELTDRVKHWRANYERRAKRCSLCRRPLGDFTVYRRRSVCYPECYRLLKDDEKST